MSHCETHPDIARQVRDVIQEVLRVEPEKICPSTRIREDLGADSLDMVTLLMALEDAFGRSISDDEAQELVSVDDVVAFTARLGTPTRSA
jgi:acyl carrier protein